MPVYWPGGVRHVGGASPICGFYTERGKASADTACRAPRCKRGALLYGCYETLIAYSDFTIERGDEVLVIDDHGSGSVDVLPWPMTTLRAGPDAQGAGGGNER